MTEDRDHHHTDPERWKHDGVRVIRRPARSQRAADARHGPQGGDQFRPRRAQKIWAGTVTIKPDAKTGAHHHGALESIIYVVRGKARMRWGEQLDSSPKRGPAISFSCRPTCRIRKSMPARTRRWNACWCAATARPSPINLDIEPVEKPETVLWVDPMHRDGGEMIAAGGRTAPIPRHPFWLKGKAGPAYREVRTFARRSAP